MDIKDLETAIYSPPILSLFLLIILFSKFQLKKSNSGTCEYLWIWEYPVDFTTTMGAWKETILECIFLGCTDHDYINWLLYLDQSVLDQFHKFWENIYTNSQSTFMQKLSLNHLLSAKSLKLKYT